VWHGIVTHLFQLKESTLIPLESLLKFIPQANPNSAKGRIELSDDVFDALHKDGVKAISAWSNYIIAKTFAHQAAVHPRRHPDIPPTARAHLTEPYLERIFANFQRCPLNFLTAHNPNNNASHHKSFLENMFFEDHFYQSVFIPTLAKFPQIPILFHHLQNIVTARDGLRTFRLWPAIPLPLPPTQSQPPATAVVDVDAYAAQLISVEAARITGHVNKAMLTFARSLSSADCLGVLHDNPRPGRKEEFHLHRSLDSLLMDFHVKAAQLATEVATIRNDKDYRNWTTYDDSESGSGSYWDQQGLKIKVATGEDMDFMYETEEVVAAKKKDEERKKALAAESSGAKGKQGKDSSTSKRSASKVGKSKKQGEGAKGGKDDSKGEDKKRKGDNSLKGLANKKARTE
jgi:hypothetical protein